MKKFGLLVLVGSLLMAFEQEALSIPPFKKAFTVKYTNKEDNATYYKLVRKTGCNVCHVKGEKKNVNNAYGKQLAALIEGHAKERLDAVKEAGDEKKKAVKDQLLKELDKALDIVAKQPKSKESPVTWGDLIQEGKLPVTIKEQVARAKEDKSAGRGDSPPE